MDNAKRCLTFTENEVAVFWVFFTVVGNKGKERKGEFGGEKNIVL
ncbi:hypothetical protein [Pantoea ananatis]|nr:hypothetical protein [Pantoea ananatis]